MLDCEESQVGVIPLDIDRWLDSTPYSPYLSELVRDRGARRLAVGDAPLRSVVLAAPGDRRAEIIQEALIGELARVLRADPGEIDPSMAFTELGLDSLVGMDFLNALEDQLSITLSQTVPWTYPTIETLVPHLLELVTQQGSDPALPRRPRPVLGS